MEKKVILEKKLKREKCNFIKNLILFDYQKTLLKLTIILFIGVIWVIRGSTAPLIIQFFVIYFFQIQLEIKLLII